MRRERYVRSDGKAPRDSAVLDCVTLRNLAACILRLVKNVARYVPKYAVPPPTRPY